MRRVSIPLYSLMMTVRLTFISCVFTDGNVIWVAEMNDDLTGIKQETLTECIKVGEPWELYARTSLLRWPKVLQFLKKEGV